MEDRNLRDRAAENELEGMGDRVKGRVKDAAGGLTGDTGLQAEGKLDQMKGRAKDALADVQRGLAGDETPRDRDSDDLDRDDLDRI